ncbi:MAG: hypothetical protein AB7O66_22680 [Limisphaerales bacterium]
MKWVARSWRLVDAALNRIGILVRSLTSGFRVQLLGRRALQEIRFARYRAATDRSEREVQERALRRLAGTPFGTKVDS